ncbi:hypothetical protein J5N97_000470 [Dioscorea zingiberensis]|uniref:Uncharacterized protein n=1 Tax=Dioscorea zingiberensis TaxID=325984 RepID=A0A9D5BSB6_9LILI|nr:hypothetical protein J5N97_000470 [Dioscorea zingiberensis]
MILYQVMERMELFDVLLGKTTLFPPSILLEHDVPVSTKLCKSQESLWLLSLERIMLDSVMVSFVKLMLQHRARFWTLMKSGACTGVLPNSYGTVLCSICKPHCYLLPTLVATVICIMCAFSHEQSYSLLREEIAEMEAAASKFEEEVPEVIVEETQGQGNSPTLRQWTLNSKRSAYESSRSSPSYDECSSVCPGSSNALEVRPIVDQGSDDSDSEIFRVKLPLFIEGGEKNYKMMSCHQIILRTSIMETSSILRSVIFDYWLMQYMLTVASSSSSEAGDHDIDLDPIKAKALDDDLVV